MPETLALADFVINHPDLNIDSLFYKWCQVILRPYHTKSDAGMNISEWFNQAIQSRKQKLKS